MSTRLPGSRYSRIFDQGRPQKGRFLVAWRYVANDADQMAGVVVSKRTFHDAVDRNRAKRLMREAYRLLVAAGKMPPQTEWVFVARAPIAHAKCADVMNDMLKVCGRS